MKDERIVSVSRTIAATPDAVFELIADPARQPEWDGNDNLSHASSGRRITGTGQVFVMTNVGGAVRENHVVEFDEGRRIAWMPAEQGSAPMGQLWRWQLQSVDGGHTEVTHTYDWARLDDEKRFARARGIGSGWLQASLDRLAGLAEDAAVT